MTDKEKQAWKQEGSEAYLAGALEDDNPHNKFSLRMFGGRYWWWYWGWLTEWLKDNRNKDH